MVVKHQEKFVMLFSTNENHLRSLGV